MRTTDKVKLPSGDGSAEIVLPAEGAPTGAVVLLQEWWGLNDHMRDVLGRLADAGFVAVAPDLYRGKTTKNESEAQTLMQSLDWGLAMADIDATVAYARIHPRSNGKVAVLGFCMGGALAFAAAGKIKGLAAVVPFYGFPPGGPDWDAIEAPILAHFAAKDDWVKPEIAQQAKTELEKRRKEIETHVYPANHAFMNDTRPEVHDPDVAKVAWDRTVEFLRARLA